MKNNCKNLWKTCAATLGVVASSIVAASPLEILLPAYFYPSFSGSAWSQITTSAAAGAPITAIMNPGSGPGTSSNSDYVTAVNAFRAAGGKVLGYVPTGYQGATPNAGSTCQPATGTSYTVNDVTACAQRYQDWYNVDGIFLDEFTNTNDVGALTFYESLYAGVKGINSSWKIVGNPGTPTQQAYLSNGANRSADTLVVFENSAGYDTYAPSTWNANFPATSFAHLAYNVNSEATMLQYLALAQQRNAGYVFITDDSGANPWDTLPAYWNSEVKAVIAANAASALPLPSSAALLLLALAGLSFRRRV